MITEMDYSIYSDLHKDARGFRPTDWRTIRAMTESEFKASCASLRVELVDSMAAEEKAEAAAIATFEAHIERLMASHGVDRATAIRWDRDAMGCSREPMEFYALEHGLPHDYFAGPRHG